MRLGMTSLIQHRGTDTGIIDVPLERLNGRTIRDTFDSNLLSNSNLSLQSNFDAWIKNSQVTFDSANKRTVINTTNAPLFSSPIMSRSIIPGEKFAVIVDGFSDSSAVLRFRLYLNNTAVGDFYPYTNPTVRARKLYVITSLDTFNQINFSRFTQNQNGYLYDVKLINLTALGIASLTESELQQLYDIYIGHTKNLVNEKDFTNLLPLTVNFNGSDSRSLIVKNIPIKPNTTYTIAANRNSNLRFLVHLSISPLLGSTQNTMYVENINGGGREINLNGVVSSTFTTTASENYISFGADNGSGEFILRSVHLEEYSVSTAYYPYGGLTFKQIFESNQLVLNGDFSNGLTSWNLTFQDQTGVTVVDGKLRFSGNFPNDSLRGQAIAISGASDQLYYSVRAFQSTGTNHFPIRIGDFSAYTNVVSYAMTKGLSSGILTNKSGGVRIYFQVLGEPRTGLDYYVDDVSLVNLTSLNISGLTKSSLDEILNWFYILKDNAMFMTKDNGLYAAGFVQSFSIDTVFADLNGLSLRQVFETNNRFADPEFTNLNAWAVTGGTPSKELSGEGILFTRSPNGAVYVSENRSIQYNQNNKYYYMLRLKSNIGQAELWMTSFGTPFNTQVVLASKSYTDFTNSSFIATAQTTQLGRINFFLNAGSFPSPTNVLYDYAYEIDLTTLGINLTKEQMDFYFNLYQSWKGGN
jgi:hypothetical protein